MTLAAGIIGLGTPVVLHNIHRNVAARAERCV